MRFPTGLFTILGTRNQEIVEFDIVIVFDIGSRPTDFEAPKLRKGWSVSTVNNLGASKFVARCVPNFIHLVDLFILNREMAGRVRRPFLYCSETLIDRVLALKL